MAEDAASLLALLRRTMDPDGYITPMLEDPDSAATLQAAIAQFARLGRAVDYNSKLALISLAPGGSPGTCMATVTRAASGTAGTIPKGYAFVDARNVQFLSSTDVTVGSGVKSVAVPLTTVRQTEAVNSEDDPEISIAAVNLVVKDGTNTTSLIAPPGDPSVVSTTFQVVASSTQVLGGATDYLSALGAERGCFRQPGESTDSYRARVRNVPDVVSPLAIAEAVTGAAAKAGGGAVILEPFNDGADPAIKEAVDLSTFDVHTYDVDSRDDTGDPEIDRYNLREVAAYFRIDLVNVLLDPGGIVKFYDGSYHDDPLQGFRDVPLPPAVIAASAGVWTEANAKRAGGVQFDVYEPTYQKANTRGSTSGGDTLVASLVPTSGNAWGFLEALVSHDTASGSRSQHWLVFTFTDSTTATTARFDRPWSQRILFEDLSAISGGLVKPLARIDLWTHAADDSSATNAVLAVWYVQLDAYP